MNIPEKVSESLRRLREERPLIHQITNYVTINDCANITLAIGAAPVMAEDVSEVAEMTSMASALVLNMGMPTPRKLKAMIVSGKHAASMGIPVIFDPVGVGATKLRLDAAQKILNECKMTVIRGNLSEIKALAGFGGSTRGVDCIEKKEDCREIAKRLSVKLGSVIAITGKVDVVANGNEVSSIDNGTTLLTGITGTGCMTTSLIACFLSVADNPFMAAIAGIAAMGVAGEIAEQNLARNEGLGTFRLRLHDAISNMTPEELLRRIKVN